MDTRYSSINYQTSFIVDNIPSFDASQKIKRQIWEWIKKKEFPIGKRNSTPGLSDSLKIFDLNDRYIPDGHGNFCNGWDLFSKGRLLPYSYIGPRKSLLRTSICYKDDSYLWGFAYLETNDDFNVLTEIGLTSYKESEAEQTTPSESKTQNLSRGVVFNIRISFHPRNAFSCIPTAKAPTLLYNLLRKETAGKTLIAHSKNAPYNFTQTPLKVVGDWKQGHTFLRFILSRNRKFPIIIGVIRKVDKDFPQFVSFSRSVSRKMLTKASLFWVDPTSEAHKYITSKHYPIHGNTTSILRLNPFTLYLIRPSVNGRYPIIEEYPLRDFDRLEEALVNHIYCQQVVLEEGAILPSDIKREISLQKLKNDHSEELESKDEEFREKKKEFDAMLEMADEEVFKNKGLMDEFERENKKLEDENRKLKAQLYRLNEQQNSQVESSLSSENQKVLDFLQKVDKCSDLRSKVESCIPLFQDRLILTKQALQSLDEAPAGLTFNLTVELLKALYFRLYPTYQSSTGQRRDTCLEGLPFTYAQHENALTKSNPKLMADRTVVYEGKSYLCEPHLKASKDDIRVYFTYIEGKKRILVGSIGEHKDTAGTTRHGH